MTLTKTSEEIKVNAQPASCPLKEEVVCWFVASWSQMDCIMGHAFNLYYKICRILECSQSAKKYFLDTCYVLGSQQWAKSSMARVPIKLAIVERWTQQNYHSNKCLIKKSYKGLVCMRQNNIRDPNLDWQAGDGVCLVPNVLFEEITT